jgi:hypothetical protein
MKAPKRVAPQFHRQSTIDKIKKPVTYLDYVKNANIPIEDKEDCVRAFRKQPYFDLTGRVLDPKKPNYTNKHWGK